MAAQAGLCLALSESPEDTFPRDEAQIIACQNLTYRLNIKTFSVLVAFFHSWYYSLTFKVNVKYQLIHYLMGKF